MTPYRSPREVASRRPDPKAPAVRAADQRCQMPKCPGEGRSLALADRWVCGPCAEGIEARRGQGWR